MLTAVKVRSFASDLAMIRYIAKNYKTCKKGMKTVNRPPTMHLCHCIDHHWAPEVVYFYPYETVIRKNRVTGSKPYSKLLSRIFVEVTGINPRKIKDFDPSEFESREFVKNTRTAQKFVLEAKQAVPGKREESSETCKLTYTLDKSWIAGLLGAIEIPGRPTILATLQPDDPEQIVVIKKPSRDMKNATLTPEQEEAAIKKAREMLKEGLPLNKAKAPIPALKGAKLFLKETEEEDSEDVEEEEEEMDEEGEEEDKKQKKTRGAKSKTNGKGSKGKAKKKEKVVTKREYFIKIKETKELVKWEDIMVDTIEIPYHQVITKGGKIKIAMTHYGEGLEVDAWKTLDEYLKEASPTIIRRALMYISGFRQSFEMGRISRDGGGTKQAVIVEDVGAFQLLIKISTIFPGALRRHKGTATTFDVPLAPLLWKVRERMGHFLAEDVDYASKKWGKIADSLDRTPWQHQLDALEEMKAAHDNGRKGHFIWIPVGMGKTWIVLSYLKFLMSVDKLPKYVLTDSFFFFVRARVCERPAVVVVR